jgi:hypothetical protein
LETLHFCFPWGEFWSNKSARLPITHTYASFCIFSEFFKLNNPYPTPLLRWLLKNMQVSSSSHLLVLILNIKIEDSNYFLQILDEYIGAMISIATLQEHKWKYSWLHVIKDYYSIRWQKEVTSSKLSTAKTSIILTHKISETI